MKSSAAAPEVTAGILSRAGQILVMFVLMAMLLFLGAGRLSWAWAWVFLAINLLSVSVNAVFMLRNSPETVAERGKPREVKTWDKWIGGSWLIGQYMLMPLLAGLDARFGWTGEYSIPWHILGAVLFACGMGLTGWAMISNAYFSTAVRIQEDRGQQVCRSGPYRFVRHPGYAGFFLQTISAPLLLGSLWVLLLAIPSALLMILRTTLEERMLQQELEGYAEYAHQVRYRLLPGVW